MLLWKTAILPAIVSVCFNCFRKTFFIWYLFEECLHKCFIVKTVKIVVDSFVLVPQQMMVKC